jgi:hypothetical protein
VIGVCVCCGFGTQVMPAGGSSQVSGISESTGR